MSKKVLLTFAGKSDPTRDDYDGPIIHICRYYRPEKIYLILTSELSEGKIDYEKAIRENLKDYNFDIEIIPTDIVDAHHFDVYFDIIYNTFEEIKLKYPKDEILVNITSGTAQLIANLISYIINVIDVKITPLQVETPAKRGNTSKPVNNKYDTIVSAQNNLDNEEEYRTNRIIKPDLNRYSRVLIKNQIKERLKLYDYATIYELLKRKIFDNNRELQTLINFAIDRKNLRGLESNKKLESLNDKKYDKLYYYTKDKKRFKVPRWYEIVDYFALAHIKQQSKNISMYSLMLEPLSYNIYVSILTDVLNKNIEEVFTYDKKKETYKIDLLKLKSEIKSFIEIEMEISSLRDNTFVANKTLAALIKYYLINEKNLSGIMSLEYFEKFCTTLEKVKEIRNNLAHTMKNVDEKIFCNEVGTDTNNISHKIKEFFEKYYTIKGYNNDMIFIYDRINENISEILDKVK